MTVSETETVRLTETVTAKVTLTMTVKVTVTVDGDDDGLFLGHANFTASAIPKFTSLYPRVTYKQATRVCTRCVSSKRLRSVTFLRLSDPD